MAQFEIRFLKDVCNDIGRPSCVLQRVVSLEAQDAGHARDEACTIFCAHERVGHWRDHADRIDVVEIEGTPRPAPPRRG
jgi:hypothetical protein